ncbi:hypothetical protein [Dysgonomonas macrotermitis]|uniref:Uncharacterized protein n=1 Tax=Dysgonomonas macrotermitis TaxID=1346286 RepID=A0A1M5EQP5_9BACT|nr:hypothetical protein [Dysgonomonas macrotermitis]SHF81565.1 hypothetical protein SAMN05444362_110112 [Dysgonomonas macrotermitis]
MKYKLYLLFITTLIIISCNSKKNDANTTEEPESSVSDSIILVNNMVEQKLDNVIGIWTYTFDRNDGMGNITYELGFFDDENGYYRPCYDDCSFIGKYKIENGILYFNGEESGDNVDPENINKINVKFTIKGSTLVTDNGEVYIKDENEEVIALRTIEDNNVASSKPTVEDIINVLHKNLFVYKHSDGFYVSFSFDYRGLDGDGNPTFLTEVSEFVPNNSIPTSPADVIMQSFNQVRYLRINKGIHFVVKEHLQNDYLVLKKKDSHDNLRYFKISIYNIIRNEEGRIKEADVYASTQGKIRLSMMPKNYRKR